MARKPEKLQISKLARTFSRRAVNTLVEIMEDESAPQAARVKCAEVILDRGYGKAPQAPPMDDSDGKRGARELSTHELMQIAAGAHRVVEAKLLDAPSHDELDPCEAIDSTLSGK